MQYWSAYWSARPCPGAPDPMELMAGGALVSAELRVIGTETVQMRGLALTVVAGVTLQSITAADPIEPEWMPLPAWQ